MKRRRKRRNMANLKFLNNLVTVTFYQDIGSTALLHSHPSILGFRNRVCLPSKRRKLEGPYYLKLKEKLFISSIMVLFHKVENNLRHHLYQLLCQTLKIYILHGGRSVYKCIWVGQLDGSAVEHLPLA